MLIKAQRILITILALILIGISPVSSFAGPGTPFNKIVFFGDSLSDNGNFYSLLYYFMPKSPPYFEGRFSNGLVWSDYVTRYFAENNNIESANFAVGGQTAVFHDPRDGFLPYTLLLSIDNYLLRTMFHDRSTTLFVMWIGSNDYLHDVKDPENITQRVTDRIKYAIERLISYGGKNFLIINLPNLSKSPFGQISGTGELLNFLSMDHNQKLEHIITDIQQNNPEIKINLFNINKMLSAYLENPEKYNKKFNLKVTHFTTSCWQGGYRLNKEGVNEKMIANDLQKHLYRSFSSGLTNSTHDLNINELARFIYISPDLEEVYEIGKRSLAGDLPCFSPNEYFFWDRIHPSAVVHSILGKYAIDYINANYEHA